MVIYAKAVLISTLISLCTTFIIENVSSEKHGNEVSEKKSEIIKDYYDPSFLRNFDPLITEQFNFTVNGKVIQLNDIEINGLKKMKSNISLSDDTRRINGYLTIPKLVIFIKNVTTDNTFMEFVVLNLRIEMEDLVLGVLGTYNTRQTRIEHLQLEFHIRREKISKILKIGNELIQIPDIESEPAIYLQQYFQTLKKELTSVFLNIMNEELKKKKSK